jgi:hypothetical protein
MLLPQLRPPDWGEPRCKLTARAQPDPRLPCVFQVFEAGSLAGDFVVR